MSGSRPPPRCRAAAGFRLRLHGAQLYTAECVSRLCITNTFTHTHSHSLTLSLSHFHLLSLSHFIHSVSEPVFTPTTNPSRGSRLLLFPDPWWHRILRLEMFRQSKVRLERGQRWPGQCHPNRWLRLVGRWRPSRDEDANMPFSLDQSERYEPGQNLHLHLRTEFG